MDSCARSVVNVRMDECSFDRTVGVDEEEGIFVSVNDVSVVLWRLQYREYFLMCKGSSRFQGVNKLTIRV